MNGVFLVLLEIYFSRHPATPRFIKKPPTFISYVAQNNSSNTCTRASILSWVALVFFFFFFALWSNHTLVFFIEVTYSWHLMGGYRDIWTIRVIWHSTTFFIFMSFFILFVMFCSKLCFCFFSGGWTQMDRKKKHVEVQTDTRLGSTGSPYVKDNLVLKSRTLQGFYNLTVDVFSLLYCTVERLTSR